MDYGMLPPEINSGRMYGGLGSAPMVAAGGAWQGLASELSAMGASFGSVISSLVAGPWMGPSSIMMTASAIPFVSWVMTHAAQAEQAATSALQTAAAFETAHASVIPPPVIAENRIRLATLISTNFMGVNSAAIAATEAEYDEFWAQDATTLYAFAGQAQAIASSLIPFMPPEPTTNPVGLAAQAAAVGQSAGQGAGQAAQNVGSAASSMPSMGSGMSSGMGSASSGIMSMGPQMMSSMTGALHGLSNPGGLMGAANPAQMLGQFGSLLQGGGLMNNFSHAVQGFGSGVASGLGSFSSIPGIAGGSGGFGGFGGGWAAPITASMGRAGSLGGLSAPPHFEALKATWADSVSASSRVPGAVALEESAPSWAVAPAAQGGQPAPAGGGMGAMPASMMGAAGQGQGGARGGPPLVGARFNRYRVTGISGV